MRKLIPIFSHQLTARQKTEIRDSLAAQVFPFPRNLRQVWANVPAQAEQIGSLVAPIIDWLEQNTVPGDFVLIQGDFGMTFVLVDFCFKNNRIPIYATSERIHREIHEEDGGVTIEKSFRHARFRRYETWKE